MNYPTLGEGVQICFVFLTIPCLTKVAHQFVADGSFNLDFYSKVSTVDCWLSELGFLDFPFV